MKRLASLLLFALPLAAQDAPMEPGKYVGASSCANAGCHGSTLPLNATRIRQNEYFTWLSTDRHAQAYNVLFNDLSARILRNMRLRNKAYQESLCLDCHSTNVPANAVAVRIDPEDGVQCEACHGPASGWRGEHTQAGWTHEQSVARGMIDLRSLPVRAASCDACHVGTRNKEVDHELIASGHPLLAFELDNYSATMPAHWNPNPTHGARAWATGEAVKFRDALDNLARHARGEKWPEFSDMSCTNCHHSLKGSQWRQVRGWPGRAGLPAWSPQHWAIVRLIVGKAAPRTRAQLDELVPQVASRVARMSDPAGVAQAAQNARKALDSAIPSIDRIAWSDAEVRALMTAIAEDRGAVIADVQAAEQAALSLQSLAAQLTRRNPRLVRGAMMRAIDALFADLENRDDYEPSRFAEKLAAVRASL
ncbi:MAG TPA: multiheme c-type cytochrome [Thermoanaerobaculia bacterium]|nr:multiheme c-type cytochrome [Thermoanaerobaculia bacterium]